MKHLPLLLLGILLIIGVHTSKAAEVNSSAPQSLIITALGTEAEDNARVWQGIPGIERAPKGRLWSIWYSGAKSEGLPGNYCVVATSGDEGNTWTKPVLLIQGPTPESSTFDAVPWLDPKGRLWLFYVQSVRDSNGKMKAYGTFAIRTDSPDDAAPKWSEPFLVFSGGRLFGKPILSHSGAWLAPIYIDGKVVDKETGVLSSTDDGASWTFLGGTSVPKDVRNYSEHTLAQRKNGDLWMIIRTTTGLSESTSTDGGHTWSAPIPFRAGPNTRAHVRRLASGAFLLVYHDLTESDQFQLGLKSKPMYPRSKIAVWLSDDEGRTWPHKLLLDTRECSYPDATQSPDGRIFVTYDSWRYGCFPAMYRYDPDAGPGKEIAFAVIREGDIRAGKIASPDSRLRQVINRATGYGNAIELKKADERKLREKGKEKR